MNNEETLHYIYEIKYEHLTSHLLFEDDQSTSSFSPDITDTVELSRRLLDILSKSDPLEAEEELRKLKEELNARSGWSLLSVCLSYMWLILPCYKRNWYTSFESRLVYKLVFLMDALCAFVICFILFHRGTAGECCREVHPQQGCHQRVTDWVIIS